jgi:hypothetical protein
MQKTVLITLTVTLMLCALLFREARAEDYTMTTYYPAPAGVYQHLTAETLTAPGLVTGGGEEQAGLEFKRMNGKRMMYDATKSPFHCSSWGEASCHKSGPSILTCPKGSTRQVTGAFLDSDLNRVKNRGFIVVKWYLCVSEAVPPVTEKPQE